MAYSDEVRTAQQVLGAEMEGQLSQEELRQVSIDAAEAAGVTHSEYVGYAAAHAAYEARGDVEPLSERRAREGAVSAADQDFRREGDGSAAVYTSPFDGNVGGLVDADGQPIDTPGA